MNNEEKILAILEKHSEMFEQINRRLDQLQDDMTHVKGRLDYDVDKRLSEINEGIDTILETMVSKSRME